jgi:hypothetical protein
LVCTYRAKEEAKRHQELMENREKERKEIQRQEVELIKEVYVSSAILHTPISKHLHVDSITTNKMQSYTMVFFTINTLHVSSWVGTHPR